MSDGRNDFLKLVGITAMVIDHLAHVFFPQVIPMYIVGRLAMPIFSVGIALGYQYTSNLNKYFVRLIILALVSQIPYFLLFERLELNILFTLALALGLIYFLEKKNYFLAILIILASVVINIDYGVYGVLMASIFYFFRQSKELSIILLSLSTLIFSLVFKNPIQPFAILAFYLIIYFPKDWIKIKLPKHFFYWFYPAHLVVLYIIKLIIQ